MTVLRFTVPGRVPSLNDLNRLKGANKGAYNAKKKAWDGLVGMSASAACRAVLARGMPEGRALIALRIIEPTRTRDPDNVAASARKFVHDGLVKWGVLAGDGWRHIVPDLPTTLEVGKPPRIEVTVTWDGKVEKPRKRKEVLNV